MKILDLRFYDYIVCRHLESPLDLKNFLHFFQTQALSRANPKNDRHAPDSDDLYDIIVYMASAMRQVANSPLMDKLVQEQMTETLQKFFGDFE